jgi:hypothetical protein
LVTPVKNDRLARSLNGYGGRSMKVESMRHGFETMALKRE